MAPQLGNPSSPGCSPVRGERDQRQALPVRPKPADGEPEKPGQASPEGGWVGGVQAAGPLSRFRRGSGAPARRCCEGDRGECLPRPGPGRAAPHRHGPTRPQGGYRRASAAGRPEKRRRVPSQDGRVRVCSIARHPLSRCTGRVDHMADRSFLMCGLTGPPGTVPPRFRGPPPRNLRSGDRSMITAPVAGRGPVLFDGPVGRRNSSAAS